MGSSSSPSTRPSSPAPPGDLAFRARRGGPASWFSERFDFEPLLRLARSKTVPVHRLSWVYLLGGATTFLFALQVASGCLLMLYYQPAEGTAHESVRTIMREVPFGWLVRSIHVWGANFSIFFAILHFLTVLITRAYRRPRELTWLSGMALLVLALGFGFSGYLLPWNELSYYATLVGTRVPAILPGLGAWIVHLLRGGEQVNGATITRFYAVHVMFLPLTFGAIVIVHLLLIQMQGMSLPLRRTIRGEGRTGTGSGAEKTVAMRSEPDRPGACPPSAEASRNAGQAPSQHADSISSAASESDGASPRFALPALFFVQPLGLRPRAARDHEPFFSEFLLLDACLWLLLLGLIVTLAVWLPAELGTKADPLKPAPKGIAPEWYFLFMFQSLKCMPEWLGLALLALGGAIFFFLPFLDRNAARERSDWRVTVLVGMMLAYVLFFQAWAWLASTARHDREALPPQTHGIPESSVSLLFFWCVIIFLVVNLFRLRVTNRRIRLLREANECPAEDEGRSR